MNRFLLPGLVGGMLLATLASSVQAVDANTPAVKGRAPVASNVVIVNQPHPGVQPRLGDVLRVSYNFEDADGDEESGTTYQWTRGHTYIGTGADTYTPVVRDVLNFSILQVTVTPKTDPQTTDPSSGTPVHSAAIRVLPANVGNFETDSLFRTWGEAKTQCENMAPSARLPTKDQLQQLSIENNTELCSRYGWPLSECGGGHFWSSTSSSADSHYAVDLSNGTERSRGDGLRLVSACVR